MLLPAVLRDRRSKRRDHGDDDDATADREQKQHFCWKMRRRRFFFVDGEKARGSERRDAVHRTVRTKSSHPECSYVRPTDRPTNNNPWMDENQQRRRCFGRPHHVTEKGPKICNSSVIVRLSERQGSLFWYIFVGDRQQ